MDFTIYLNDRKYRVCDIGEGKCTLMLSHAEGIESLHEHFSHQFLELERMIIIDISICWGGDIEALCEKDRCELITDVRLLTDIYWLDDFEIKTDKGQDIFMGFKSLSPI
ncbi:hypothetical protein AB4251_00675 [Vibrio lentus]|uniref:Uncharacterized protein n=1 Tax=Vibrio lentus TaxID=136468 RepID=A0AB36XU38_9VIBR|nr:hypothetical protein [Vibrio lentus]MCC4838714.1 hypothetical protein [Vibrio lentus]PMI16777.1 hypothetical protein BCU51_05115 [Vibrio lentus]PMK36698.1 hypothetical protein BCU02_11745 [Vibrio lentus]PMK50317.1 hypothetical protein BCT99_02540 [Vibrio lentus]PML27979.1 hypothetical protein BCT79_07575 [Vibrio lentus]